MHRQRTGVGIPDEMALVADIVAPDPFGLPVPLPPHLVFRGAPLPGTAATSQGDEYFAPPVRFERENGTLSKHLVPDAGTSAVKATLPTSSASRSLGARRGMHVAASDDADTDANANAARFGWGAGPPSPDRTGASTTSLEDGVIGCEVVLPLPSFLNQSGLPKADPLPNGAQKAAELMPPRARTPRLSSATATSGDSNSDSTSHHGGGGSTSAPRRSQSVKLYGGKVELFSSLIDTTPHAHVQADEKFFSRSNCSSASTQRQALPRPAPGFRDTEAWQRAFAKRRQRSPQPRQGSRERPRVAAQSPPRSSHRPQARSESNPQRSPERTQQSFVLEGHSSASSVLNVQVETVRGGNRPHDASVSQHQVDASNGREWTCHRREVPSFETERTRPATAPSLSCVPDRGSESNGSKDFTNDAGLAAAACAQPLPRFHTPALRVPDTWPQTSYGALLSMELGPAGGQMQADQGTMLAPPHANAQLDALDASSTLSPRPLIIGGRQSSASAPQSQQADGIAPSANAMHRTPACPLPSGAIGDVANNELPGNSTWRGVVSEQPPSTHEVPLRKMQQLLIETWKRQQMISATGESVDTANAEMTSARHSGSSQSSSVQYSRADGQPCEPPPICSDLVEVRATGADDRRSGSHREMQIAATSAASPSSPEYTYLGRLVATLPVSNEDEVEVGPNPPHAVVECNFWQRTRYLGQLDTNHVGLGLAHSNEPCVASMATRCTLNDPLAATHAEGRHATAYDKAADVALHRTSPQVERGRSHAHSASTVFASERDPSGRVASSAAVARRAVEAMEIVNLPPANMNCSGAADAGLSTVARPLAKGQLAAAVEALIPRRSAAPERTEEEEDLPPWPHEM